MVGEQGGVKISASKGLQECLPGIPFYIMSFKICVTCVFRFHTMTVKIPEFVSIVQLLNPQNGKIVHFLIKG